MASDRTQVVLRRLRSISIVTLAFVVVTATLPVLLLGALLYDVGRFVVGQRTFSAIRLGLVAWWYLCAEVLGVVALAIVWAASGGGRNENLLLDLTYTIQRWWASSIFTAVRTLFGLKIEVEGSDIIAPGPVVVFMRHASILDNLLPSALIVAPHGLNLRYVLKRELLSDPALDVAGSRLPNYFVDRGSGDSTAELAAIRKLAGGLTDHDGVLIYPEGTRFTPERRTRALERLKSVDPGLYERAKLWTSVLPPRPGGALALLEVTNADVLIVAHTGLDGFSHFADLVHGALVGRVVNIQFRRFTHTALPQERRARIEWLYDRWDEVDHWVADAESSNAH